MKKFMVMLFCFAMAGCSATSLLSSLTGSDPGVTAQVGAENTKQTVGLNNKVDTSSEVKTEVKGSNVASMDTSNGKKVSASSISADTIKADKIEIRNGESDYGALAAFFIAGLLFGAILVTLLVVYRKRKAAS